METERTGVEDFFECLDHMRKVFHTHKDYRHMSGVDFYIGRGRWSIAAKTVLTEDRAQLIRRRMQKEFPQFPVVINYFEYYTVRMYYRRT